MEKSTRYMAKVTRYDWHSVTTCQNLLPKSNGELLALILDIPFQRVDNIPRSDCVFRGLDMVGLDLANDVDIFPRTGFLCLFGGSQEPEAGCQKQKKVTRGVSTRTDSWSPPSWNNYSEPNTRQRCDAPS